MLETNRESTKKSIEKDEFTNSRDDVDIVFIF